MQEIDMSLSKNYPPLNLYLNDLEEINNIFRSNFKNYEIKIDKYLLSDFSEIENINLEKTNSAVFDTFEGGYTFLSLSPSSITLKIANKDEDKLISVFYKIDMILVKKENSLNIIFSMKFFRILIIIAIIFMLIPWFSPKSYSIIYFIISLSLVIVALVTSYIGFIYNHSKIYLIRSDGKSNFFKRNKDELIVGTLGAFLGGILVLIISMIIN